MHFLKKKTIWKKNKPEKQFSENPKKDSFISGLLMSAPAAILSILLVFSSPYFHATLITCSLRYSTVLITVWFKIHATETIFRATEEYQHAQNADFRSYRYDYSFFDYNFIQGYCYANMYDYEVNQTSGYVDKGIGFASQAMSRRVPMT